MNWLQIFHPSPLVYCILRFNATIQICSFQTLHTAFHSSFNFVFKNVNSQLCIRNWNFFNELSWQSNAIALPAVNWYFNKSSSINAECSATIRRMSAKFTGSSPDHVQISLVIDGFASIRFNKTPIGIFEFASFTNFISRCFSWWTPCNKLATVSYVVNFSQRRSQKFKCSKSGNGFSAKASWRH